MKGLVNEAGGLLYHWRAWRHGHLWGPYHSRLARLLRAWPVSHTRDLLLVGPSAGYSLPLDFVCSFKNVLGLEPDPLARWLLERRLRTYSGCEIRWFDRDVFSPNGGTWSIEPLTAFVQEHCPDAALLFCNILGQLPFLYDECQAPIYDAWKREFSGWLSARGAWASYHDLYSYNPREPNVRYDHLTKDLFPALSRRMTIEWRLRPGLIHEVEFLAQSERRDREAAQLRTN